MPQPLLIDRNDTIVTVTLNNPKKLNALDKPKWAALRDTMRDLSMDESIRCIVIRGAGDQAFAAGADISEFKTERSDASEARAYDALMREALEAIFHCAHPTVAMIKGACVGAGLEIAVHCDMRICGRSSRFGAPINRLGLCMPCPEIEAIVRLLGPAVALEILLEGRVFDADEAFQKGMVNRIADDDKVEQEAYATATRIANGAPLVARWHKKFVHRLMEPKPVTAEECEPGYFYFETEDFKNGVKAFLNKEKASFKGR